tara:strand:+ start:6085 stop:6243 length:159 start_codon:yes stop_codon:yes gene_type:complete
MPIPSPNPKEKNSDFMNRCMSYLSDKKEFKDSKQRAAVCYSQLARKKKPKKD